MKIKPQLISVRDISESDIPLILNYWFRSPAGFIEGMGVDPKKMPLESDFRKSLEEKIYQNKMLSFSKLNALAITYDNNFIGFHTINPLVEGDYGIFHAHITDSEFRRCGIGLHTYPKACAIFLKRFNLDRILFKTPSQNTAAIRVKQKIGIRLIGEELIGFGIIKDGTHAKVFELTREEAKELFPNV